MVLAVLYGIGKEIQDFDFINVRCCLKTSSNLQNREDYFKTLVNKFNSIVMSVRKLS